MFKTRMIKQIRIDLDKCIGCRSCELACSAFHSEPRYSSINPSRSRIRVMVDELKNAYVPVRAGDYTSTECPGRHIYTINGKEYRECSFCKAACPSRDYFKDPDSGIPFKCDMCESDPPLDMPWCVKVCGADALVYEEKEVADTADNKSLEEIETGLESLMNTFGKNEVLKALNRKIEMAARQSLKK